MSIETVTDQVCNILAGMSVPDDAALTHRAAVRALRRNGYFVETEVAALRGGRVDICAYHMGEDVFVAIEIDRRTPRVKSVNKLRNFHMAGRVIALRGRICDAPEGIDRIVCIPVHGAAA